jgi:hypothetical protein
MIFLRRAGQRLRGPHPLTAPVVTERQESTYSNFSVYGQRRPGKTAGSTAVPGGLLTRKGSQVQTLSRPPGTTHLRSPTQRRLSADWLTGSAASGGPDELGFVLAGVEWSWAGSSSAPGPPRPAPPDPSWRWGQPELGQACGGRQRRRPGRRGPAASSQLDRCDGAECAEPRQPQTTS